MSMKPLTSIVFAVGSGSAWRSASVTSTSWSSGVSKARPMSAALSTSSSSSQVFW